MFKNICVASMKTLTVRYLILTLQIHKWPQKVQNVEDFYIIILMQLPCEARDSITKGVIKET